MPKVTKQRLNTAERDKKKMSMYLRKRLEAVSQGHALVYSEQYLELPRALYNKDGMPNKGNKCSTRDLLETRYQHICTPKLLTDWSLECVVIDGIFMIHTPPKDGSTMKQYAVTLIQKFLYHYIQRGTEQLHVVFNYPDFQTIPNKLNTYKDMVLKTSTRTTRPKQLLDAGKTS